MACGKGWGTFAPVNCWETSTRKSCEQGRRIDSQEGRELVRTGEGELGGVPAVHKLWYQKERLGDDFAGKKEGESGNKEKKGAIWGKLSHSLRERDLVKGAETWKNVSGEKGGKEALGCKKKLGSGRFRPGFAQIGEPAGEPMQKGRKDNRAQPGDVKLEGGYQSRKHHPRTTKTTGPNF